MKSIMSQTNNKMLLIATDFAAFNISFLFLLYMRIQFGLYAVSNAWNILWISSGVGLFWIAVYGFFGMYRNWIIASRIDEMIDMLKAITFGVFLLFMITFDFEKDFSHPFRLSRLVIVLYWFIMIMVDGSARVFLHSFQRKLIERGVGRKKTLIIGWGKKAWELFDQVSDAPALGYEVVGFISQSDSKRNRNYRNVPLVGPVNHLKRFISNQMAEELLIALPRRSEQKLQEIIAMCEGLDVGIKIVPDLYAVMVGQVRTNQIYGFPLIEILPQLITPWERFIKRILDILFSLLMIAGFLPLWLLIAVLIRLDSRGPVFYLQERVGKNGRLFHVVKFRSMMENAEHVTGPVWASENDKRVTRVGKWMRKLRLDEVPQFVNVLSGQMSLVGPRPERPYFVDKLKKVYPLYVRRLRIRPGITGWAQVKGEYDQSLEHVKQKLEYDLFYLENMSLRMDLKIILHTMYVMLMGKGQ